MRIFNFELPIRWIKAFVFLGTIVSCLVYFWSTVVDFKTYVYGVWSFITLMLLAGAIYLFKQTLTRKRSGKLRFLSDVCFVAVNLILLDEYILFAQGHIYSHDGIGYVTKASAILIIGFCFGGMAYLMTHREFMKKVWS